MPNKYADIIDLPSYKSKKFKPMAAVDRANQFAPFQALKGHDEEMMEVSRLVDDKILLSDYQKQVLNQKLQYINNNLPIEVQFLYFKKDMKKDGGCYLKYTNVVKKIDEVNRIIIFKDKTKIRIDDILLINCDTLDI